MDSESASIAQKQPRTPFSAQWAAAAGKTIAANAWGFFFPPLCVLCDNPLSKNDPWLCTQCLKKLNDNARNRNACPRCSQNRDRHICACELAWDFPFSRAFSLFDFDDTVKDIAHHFKYKGRKALAFHIGKTCAKLVPPDIFSDIHAIAAIPLHFFRKMKRGYNQAEYFAKGIIKGLESDLPFLHNVLRRTRHTKTQTKLDKEQREKNLTGAFAVHPSKADLIRDKNLILVDDVVTTGATTGHCTRALLAAGAKEVRVLSLARD